jgi:hypothetical protein
VTVSTQDYDFEGPVTLRGRVVGQPALRIVPAVGQTASLFEIVNTDGTATMPTGYTRGGVSSMGPYLAVKSTSGAPADTDFSGASPVIPVPAVGTAIYNSNDSKIYVRHAAGTWKATAALS